MNGSTPAPSGASQLPEPPDSSRLSHTDRAQSFHPERFRPLFYIAALWNLAAAGVALGAPDYHAEIFFGSDQVLANPAAAMNTQIVWISVAFFGIGYWIVARDPSKNHALILIAALGKACVAFLWFSGFLLGTVTSFALLGAAGDLIFATLFAHFLLRAYSSSGEQPRI